LLLLLLLFTLLHRFNTPWVSQLKMDEWKWAVMKILPDLSLQPSRFYPRRLGTTMQSRYHSSDTDRQWWLGDRGFDISCKSECWVSHSILNACTGECITCSLCIGDNSSPQMQLSHFCISLSIASTMWFRHGIYLWTVQKIDVCEWLLLICSTGTSELSTCHYMHCRHAWWVEVREKLGTNLGCHAID